MPTIDRKSPVPLYFQISKEITRIIHDLRIGDKIPTEDELSVLFSVSRPTIRQALKVLESEGMVNKKRGLGTYVTNHKIDTGLTNVISLADQLKKENINFTSKVFNFLYKKADPEIASNLNIQPSTEIVFIERLRSVDGEPMYLTRGYVIPSLCKDILKANLETEAIFESINKYCGIVTNRVKRILEAIPASKTIAKLLEIDYGSPVSYLQTFAYSIDGNQWGYFKDYLRWDKCRFSFSIETGPFALSRMPAQLKDKVDIELIGNQS